MNTNDEQLAADLQAAFSGLKLLPTEPIKRIDFVDRDGATLCVVCELADGSDLFIHVTPGQPLGLSVQR